MAEVYDELMFHGATFADLLHNGRPLLSVDATDVDYEVVFPFTQEQFDLICSDLTSYPIARAVAASNGFPVLFTPITLKDYADQCGGRKPPWIQEQNDVDPLSRRHYLARTSELYLDPARTRYVHLLDGGISDNLALRGVIDAALLVTGDRGALARTNLSQVRRILLISVDGEAAADTAGARSSSLSSIAQIFGAVSGTEIDAYNFETLILARKEIADLAVTIGKQRCGKAATINGYACGDVEGYFMHLSLADISDPAIRNRLQQIPTGLTLSDSDVDRLIAAGESAIGEAPELRAFRASLSVQRSARPLPRELMETDGGAYAAPVVDGQKSLAILFQRW